MQFVLVWKQRGEHFEGHFQCRKSLTILSMMCSLCIHFSFLYEQDTNHCQFPLSYMTSFDTFSTFFPLASKQMTVVRVHRNGIKETTVVISRIDKEVFKITIKAMEIMVIKIINSTNDRINNQISNNKTETIDSNRINSGKIIAVKGIVASIAISHRIAAVIGVDRICIDSLNTKPFCLRNNQMLRRRNKIK